MSRRLLKQHCLALVKQFISVGPSFNRANPKCKIGLLNSYDVSPLSSGSIRCSSLLHFSTATSGTNGDEQALPSVKQCELPLNQNKSDDSVDAFARMQQYPSQAAIAMMFTCAKCETRSVRTFSRHSYEKGLVLVRCPGCRSLHLIADHLGWFDDDKSFTIEKYLNETGQKYHKASVDDKGETHVLEISGQSSFPEEHASSSSTSSKATVSLSVEDIAGWTKVQRLLKEISGASDNGSLSEKEAGDHHCDDHQHHNHEHDHDHDHDHDHKCSNGGGGGCGGGCGSGGGCGNNGGCGGGGGCGNNKNESSEALKKATVPIDDSTLEVSPDDLALWAKVQQKVKEAVNQREH
mmetsp:Transcript_29659/g.54391  ORF Transcript_29659/g.54391 Transcript_29659/m.54391 type:complete len:350 (-) Transcript_29659:100-1149(-)|eukprot:CAMPEP_0175076840 /NCGR_PEP_ID=MMETSP0052_2-20121109/22996_1 /TAXON_ID=51329 ORGANISM="Polytomella parva, Strain SAG 63-3" /NCGR_SAMPLE_ID=MMETSP0052_2 /ASSEMBLY_ACC=CAM_ASM_000194 /LENGTH=349 /DNA_ID=CAMNT_0016346115 /DNA_START=27 /DNA_END=1076 /DNA_ORIENTATION=+